MRRERRPKEPAWTLEAAPLKTAGAEAAGTTAAGTVTTGVAIALTEATTDVATALGTVKVTVEAAPLTPQPQTAVTVVIGIAGLVWLVQPQPVAVTVPVKVTVVRPPLQDVQMVTKTATLTVMKMLPAGTIALTDS